MEARAGAVVCETRDLGIKWPQWISPVTSAFADSGLLAIFPVVASTTSHPLRTEGQVAVDMRVVCPMLPSQARTVYWKTLAAKHECEESKEGWWLEPIQATPFFPSQNGGGNKYMKMQEIVQMVKAPSGRT